MDLSLIIGAIVSILVSIISGTALAKSARLTQKLEDLSASVTTLENTAVTDSHVRQVVKEELQPLSVQMGKLMDSMETIKAYIAEEKGYKAGQAAAARRKEDDQ